MSKNQRRILKLIMLPVRNHPQGRTLISHYQAVRHEKEGRCVILEGECLWMNHQPQELRYNREKTRGEWCGQPSGKYIAAIDFREGPTVMQLTQGV